MRSTCSRIGAAALLAGILTATLVAAPAQGAVPNTADCTEHLSGGPDGSLNLTSDPAPGDNVPAGTSIDITATWDDANWHETDKILSCTTTDGVWDPRLAGGQRPVDNDGSFMWSVYVPSSTAEGTDLCVRGVLFGMAMSPRSSATNQSNELCFTTAAAVVTTSDTTPTTTPTTAPTIAAPITSTTTTVQVTAPVVDPSLDTSGQSDPAGPVMQGAVAADPLPLEALPRTGTPTMGLLALAGAALGMGAIALALAVALARRNSTSWGAGPS